MARGGPRKGAGRKPGVPSKKTQDVADRLAALGCDPLEGMAMIAMNEENAPELRGRMFAELAQYVLPKRKAIEHSGPAGGPIPFTGITRTIVEPAQH